MALGIRRGDKVKIIAGRDKGKTGKVIHVYPKKGRALVEGINLAKKHVRRSQQNPQGGVLSKEIPIQVSNLSLMDPASNKVTRIKMLVAKDGSKQRVSAKSKAVFA